MHTLQTILLETAPPSSNTQWDLQALRQHVSTAEDRTCAAGLRLGTKLDNVAEPKVLTIVGRKTVCYTACPYSTDVGPPGRKHSFISFLNIFEP